MRCNVTDLPDNVIGATVFLNDEGFVQHAGVFIRYNGESKLFHYTGTKVVLEDFNDTQLYFFKSLEIIDPKLAASVLMHCEVVEKEAKPKYGYFYAGSMYDENGKFISAGNLPEYMTCVGFCLNFIKYIMKGKDWFNYTEWNAATVGKGDEFAEQFIEKVKTIHPTINLADFKKNIRRIWPIDYISGSYSDEIPVSKKFTDDIGPQIQEYLDTKLTA